jgi:hypothetical protein
MTHITKRQHYIPDFYLRQWTDPIPCHDLHKVNTFACGPPLTRWRRPTSSSGGRTRCPAEKLKQNAALPREDGMSGPSSGPKQPYVVKFTHRITKVAMK